MEEEREFSTEEMRSYTADCPLCGETAFPTWERIDAQPEPESVARWKLASLNCLTPGCPNSRYSA
jgi:hypothetical protein